MHVSDVYRCFQPNHDLTFLLDSAMDAYISGDFDTGDSTMYQTKLCSDVFSEVLLITHCGRIKKEMISLQQCFITPKLRRISEIRCDYGG